MAVGQKAPPAALVQLLEFLIGKLKQVFFFFLNRLRQLLFLVRNLHWLLLDKGRLGCFLDFVFAGFWLRLLLFRRGLLCVFDFFFDWWWLGPSR